MTSAISRNSQNKLHRATHSKLLHSEHLARLRYRMRGNPSLKLYRNFTLWNIRNIRNIWIHHFGSPLLQKFFDNPPSEDYISTVSRQTFSDFEIFDFYKSFRNKHFSVTFNSSSQISRKTTLRLQIDLVH